MEFNKNRAAIHAYLSGDGYVVRNKPSQKHKSYVTALRNTNKILLEDFKKKVKEEFKFDITPRIRKDGRCIINSKELYFYLTKEHSYYCKEWRVPKLNSKEEYKCWIRAMFDCESWVYVKKGVDRRIGMELKNKEGIYKIQEILKKVFSIQSQVKWRKKKEIYHLDIFSKENLNKFKKKINFLHPEKKEKLIKALRSYQNYNWNVSFLNYKAIIKEKLNVRKPHYLRTSSIKKKNLTKLKEIIEHKFGIKCYVSARKNGSGNRYYEFNINRRKDTEKIKPFLSLENQEKLAKYIKQE